MAFCVPSLAASGGDAAQHQQHRFEQNFECDLPDPAPVLMRYFVCTFSCEARSCFDAGQAVHFLLACKALTRKLIAPNALQIDLLQVAP